jgi:hypothetical protein
MSIENISRKELYDIVARTPRWRQLSDGNALDLSKRRRVWKVLDGGGDPNIRRISLPSN